MGRHVAFDLAFELGHRLAAGHEIRDLLSGLLTLAEVGRLGAPNQNRKVVPDSQGVNDLVGDEDDCDAFLAANARRWRLRALYTLARAC